MGQPVTTNPILIAAINMTVVFAVLYGLSLIVNLIRIIDPTQKKKITQNELPVVVNSAPVVADAAIEEDYDEMMILFTAAIAAYGHGDARIVAIRPIGAPTWTQVARTEGVNRKNGMN